MQSPKGAGHRANAGSWLTASPLPNIADMVGYGTPSHHVPLFQPSPKRAGGAATPGGTGAHASSTLEDLLSVLSSPARALGERQAGATSLLRGDTTPSRHLQQQQRQRGQQLLHSSAGRAAAEGGDVDDLMDSLLTSPGPKVRQRGVVCELARLVDDGWRRQRYFPTSARLDSKALGGRCTGRPP
jgi:hypothetical protein